MNLLIRFIRFCAVSAFRLLSWLIARLARLLLPYFLATIRAMGRLVFTSLVATVHGPRQYVDRRASEWTLRVLEMGISRNNIDQIFDLCRFLSYLMVAVGWLIITVFTVILLRVVFGYFI